MKVKIRKSSAKDWKIIQNLNLEVYINSYQFDSHMNPNDPDSEDSTKGFQDDVINQSKLCLIAEKGSKPVGYLVGGENNLSWRTNRRGEIFHMGVSPEYRAYGIGGMLVAEFKKWCLEKGLTHIAATTYFADDKARNFYEKQGMTPIDISLEGPIK
jgi:ribosomal protein S18 acetylase RimI-like enzyme